ncbi:hypothetical protein CC77DRAFT_1017361 [Alternaria alternata]|uniref:Uncharacterized protein n=1 Tax=Alternaria alternata TaxID=5599 RepID=A0A177DVL0_ALTAL|nr:hypothetical protein CC77DRAFT_1017361 [Alternaria alternata]KAH6859472.1 hypothetical protein B0T12DRAFT_113302 [Alternaria alternata]OAG23714.1 hypothetical protein CC77DRAFT_1017361 [Alternaria alternata]
MRRMLLLSLCSIPTHQHSTASVIWGYLGMYRLLTIAESSQPEVSGQSVRISARLLEMNLRSPNSGRILTLYAVGTKRRSC